MNTIRYTVPVGTKVEIQMADNSASPCTTYPTTITTRKILVLETMCPFQHKTNHATFHRGNLLLTVHENDLVPVLDQAHPQLKPNLHSGASPCHHSQQANEAIL